MATDGRVTQANVEVLTQGNVAGRITHENVEVLTQGNDAGAITTAYLEVLTSTETYGMATTMYLEVLTDNPAPPSSTDIKAWDNVAYADIKTLLSLAVASTKTVDGLA